MINGEIGWASEIDTLEDELREMFSNLSPNEMIHQFALYHQNVLQSEAKFEQSRVLAETLRLIRKIFGIILIRSNPILQTYGIAFATGLDLLNGMTMTEAATRCSPKVSRAAVSKVTKEWQRVLNFPSSRYMKSEKACEAYSKTQKENHWRNRDPSQSTIFKPERKNG
jgi:hypothetical protein